MFDDGSGSIGSTYEAPTSTPRLAWLSWVIYGIRRTLYIVPRYWYTRRAIASIETASAAQNANVVPIDVRLKRCCELIDQAKRKYGSPSPDAIKRDVTDDLSKLLRSASEEESRS